MDFVWPLACVFTAIAALYAVLRLRVALRGSQGVGLQVIESCVLDPKTRLHVVAVDGNRLLVGGSEGNVTLLRELSPAPEPEPEPAPRTASAPNRRLWLRWGAASLLLALAFASVGGPAHAQETSGDSPPQIVLSLGEGEDASGVAPALELLALLTVVSIAPSILLMMTCFTRIVIVLAFVRQAVGVQHLPPNQVLVGLALFLTVFVMAPTGRQIHAHAWVPFAANEIDVDEATERGLAPIRDYMLSFTREADLALFAELAEQSEVEELDELGMSTLVPAFMISELRTAFEIGFMVFLPFLIIDLVISSMLISMGMIVLPPVVVSLPFKVMLFVLADGWNLILGSLLDGLR